MIRCVATSTGTRPGTRPEQRGQSSAGVDTRAESSVTDLDLLLELAPEVPHSGYRNGLIEYAVGGALDLPADRIAAARRFQVGD